MKSALALVAGVGLLAFGVFLVVVTLMVLRPAAGDPANPDWVATGALAVGAAGGVCTLIGLGLSIAGAVGSRRAARAYHRGVAADAGDHPPNDQPPSGV